MNIAVFVAALALDLTVGFVGAKLGSKTDRVHSLNEVTADVERILAASNYSGPKVVVAISPNHSEVFEAYTQYSPMFDQINMVVFPHVLGYSSKKYRTVVAHEACHILYDQVMLLAKEKVDDSERARRESSAWDCANRLRKNKKLWKRQEGK